MITTAAPVGPVAIARRADGNPQVYVLQPVVRQLVRVGNARRSALLSSGMRDIVRPMREAAKGALGLAFLLLLALTMWSPWWWYKVTDQNWTALAAIASALGAVGSVAAAWMAYLAARASQDSARATLRSAEASAESVIELQRQHIAQIRPVIFIDEVTVHHSDIAIEKIEVSVRNTGPGAAAGCEVHVESTDGRITLQGEGSFGNLDVRERHSASAIVPDDSTGQLLLSVAKSKGLLSEVVYSNIEGSIYKTEVRTKWNGRRFASSGSRFFESAINGTSISWLPIS